MKTENTYHVPVMAEEIAEWLLWKKDGVYVDATLGGGGHTAYLLSKLGAEARIIGLDVDQDAIRFASKRFENESRVFVVNLGYDQIDFILEDLNIQKIDGILYDLGISSFQVDEEEKGFSFMKDAPLDMRFDQTQKLTAEHVVNSYSEQDLVRIFREYGEEKKSRAIARKIVEIRRLTPIKTTRQLAEIVEKIAGSKQQIKSLARIFQAIRIEVNREFEKLSESLNKVLD
ncbi:MAG: 16S rRNA (cytosine(1402)-N(4))-methyltransferase RsmH, partial [Methanobacteriota archaeon]